MLRAELVFANVLDERLFASQGEEGQPLVYTLSLPGRALPIAVARQWKAPQGVVAEHFEFVAPSGKTSYRSEPRPRRMPGQMDLTRLVDVVDDAIFGELGIHLASFLVDGEAQGQVEFQVVLQQAPAQLPEDVEEGLKKSDVIWVGVEGNGKDRAVPVWFVYRDGRIYVLHALDEGVNEQQIPGLPDAAELVVITRRKGRETRNRRFPAAVRLIPAEAPEFKELAGLLADRRRDSHTPPAQVINGWRSSCVIAELTPTVP
ncbi:MAG: hypothetical protein ACRDH6_08890 [Actinomycetota bacterium]